MADIQLTCPRCGRPVATGDCASCRAHGPAASRKRAALRVAVGASAGVAGMVLGALTVALLAGFLGLAPELIVLLMLVAELGCGGLSAYLADRRVQRFLRERNPEAGQLPEARLLSGRRE